MKVLGIDPGLDGAFALLTMDRDQRTPFLDIIDTPTDRKINGRRDIIEAKVAQIIRTMNPDHAYIEDVHSMPAQGVASTFTFGVTFGVVRGVVAALGIPTTKLTPQQWMRRVALTKATTCTLRACALFPSFSDLFPPKKDGRADAALIALAGWRELMNQ